MRDLPRHLRRGRKPFQSNPSVRERSAFVDAMALAAAADGELSDEEEGYLREALAQIPEFGKLDNDELGRLIRDALDRVARDGVEQCVAMLADALPTPAGRRSAYGLAVLVTLADGRLAQGEPAVLELLAAGLGIPDGEAKAVIAELREVPTS